MNDADILAGLIAIWKRSIDDFVALTRSLTEDQGAVATDLPGWNVRDVVAHTAHLEAVLAGGPEETIEVPEAPHIKGIMGVYTEQGVLARRGRSLAEMADEIEQAAAIRYEQLQADPPTDLAGTPAHTPGGVPWDNRTLLGNRPLDVWMHEQDIRRAVDRPGGFDSPAAIHVIDALGGGLAMVVGKRVAPPAGTSVRVDVPEVDRTWTVLVGDDGRARFAQAADPTATITVSGEGFVLLSGGRHGADRSDARIAGDTDLARRVLDSMAITP